MEDNQVMVLLESVDSKMQLVLEAFSVLDKKIDDVKQHLTERADLTDFKIDVLNKKIDTVEANLNKRIDTVEANLNKRIDTVETNLTDKIDTISTDLKAHRKDTEAHPGLYVVREG
jgi:chaperonin cofactor prefoldin